MEDTKIGLPPTTINWEDLHRRLKSTQTTLEQGLEPTPEEKRRILKQRAKALAREQEIAEEVQEYFEVVEFLLSYETYGIESSYVREAYPLTEITPLPGTPSFVLGIINVRGQIISVIDIKKFFDLPEKGLTDLNKVIIVRDQNMEFGILADAILGVKSIAATEMQLSLPTLTGIRADYLKGVSKEQMVILDIAKISF